MATATRTVRIQPETHRKLHELAKEMETTLPDVLEKAISEYERRRFLEGVAEDFARLRANPKLWQEELEERRLWECTLMDDLHDDPYQWDAEPANEATPEKSS